MLGYNIVAYVRSVKIKERIVRESHQKLFAFQNV